MADKRPQLTTEMIQDYFKAAFCSNKVSEEVFQDRQQICRSCDKKKTDRFKIDFCGMCGCSVANTRFKIINLCAYEEEWDNGKLVSRHGCKHPMRKYGKGWPRPK